MKNSETGKKQSQRKVSRGVSVVVDGALTHSTSTSGAMMARERQKTACSTKWKGKAERPWGTLTTGKHNLLNSEDQAMELKL